MAYDAYPRILSRPVPIHWAGWETDTYRLQRAGWQLSARQDIQGHRLQLAFRRGQSRGLGGWEAITEIIPWDYQRMMDARIASYDLPPLRVSHAIGDQVLVHMTGPVSVDGWGPIDAEPRLSTGKITRLEDFAHFAGPLIRTNEIIVPEESVPELLERILKMQQPARTDRIREELRGERRPEQRFHAQIISLKDVA